MSAPSVRYSDTATPFMALLACATAMRTGTSGFAEGDLSAQAWTFVQFGFDRAQDALVRASPRRSANQDGEPLWLAVNARHPWRVLAAAIGLVKKPGLQR